jgi:RHS repeat-associated protein
VTSYYLYDGQGSVRGLTNSAGAVTDSYSYDAFGNLLTSQGSTVNPYRYDGQLYDSLTGLYDLRARYYDPTVGRFTSADTADVTLDNPTELNRYLYVASDPVNAADPTGHTLEEEAELEEQIAIQNERVVEAYRRSVSLITAIDDAHELAILARLFTTFAGLIYQRLAPGNLPYTQLGTSGVGLSLYIDRFNGAIEKIAALNDVPAGRIPLMAYSLYYTYLRLIVGAVGFRIIHWGDLGIPQVGAGQRHEERYLMDYLRSDVGSIRGESFPIIGVSQNFICGECLRTVFRVPNIPSRDKDSDAVCVLDPIREIFVVGAAVISRPPFFLPEADLCAGVPTPF